MPILLDLFLTFLKIGVVSFGGGYGMISVLNEEVLSHGWLTESEILNLIAISESTPGPIAINMATFVGVRTGGILGSILATLGVVLPAFIIILIIASIAKNLLKFKVVDWALKGIRPIVIALIIGTGLTLLFKLLFNMDSVFSPFSFDFLSLILLFSLVLFIVIIKRSLKRSVSPITIIAISAVLGVVTGFIVG